MIKALIFDFNGVIVESTDVNAGIYARIFSAYGEDVVRRIAEHYRQVGGIPRQARIEMYLRDFAGVEPTPELIEEISAEFSRLYLESLRSAAFVPGVKEFLSGPGQNYDKFLSSGAPDQDIPQMLQILGLEDYFIKGFGAPAPKHEHIANILQAYAYQPEQVVFIGDSPKDRDAARRNSIWFVARDRGLETLKAEPFKIKDLTELEAVLRRINRLK